MKFHQTLSEAEYVAASLYMMKRQAREPQWLALIIALVIMIPTIAWLVFANDERYWFAMFMVFFVVVLLMIPHTVRQTIRKAYRDPANAMMFEPREYELSDSGLLVMSSTGTSQMSWSAFIGVFELPTVIGLQQSKQTAVIIGTGDFNADELQTLRAMLKNHFPKAKLG